MYLPDCSNIKLTLTSFWKKIETEERDHPHKNLDDHHHYLCHQYLLITASQDDNSSNKEALRTHNE